MARTGACPHPRAQQQIIRLSVSCLHKIGQASAPSQRETVMRERLPMKECSGCSGVCGRGGQVAMLVLQRRVWRRGWRAGSCQVMGGNIHLEVLGGTCAHAPCSNPSGWTPFFQHHGQHHEPQSNNCVCYTHKYKVRVESNFLIESPTLPSVIISKITILHVSMRLSFSLRGHCYILIFLP